MLLQPQLGEMHNIALLKLQICPRQRFRIVHLICKRSYIYNYIGGEELAQTFLSLSLSLLSFCSTTTTSPLQLMGDLRSQSGYNLCQLYSLEAVVQHDNMDNRKRCLHFFSKLLLNKRETILFPVLGNDTLA